MGLFNAILSKLGFGHHDDTAQTPAAAAPTATVPAADTPTVVTTAPSVTAMPEVDVVAKLDQWAAANPQKLNWKVSIVDLLKLLDLDSSLDARKSLATELGCPPDLMSDSAQMNIWLHKMVLKKLAENGGNIPKDLLQ